MKLSLAVQASFVSPVSSLWEALPLTRVMLAAVIKDQVSARPATGHPFLWGGCCLLLE